MLVAVIVFFWLLLGVGCCDFPFFSLSPFAVAVWFFAAFSVLVIVGLALRGKSKPCIWIKIPSAVLDLLVDGDGFRRHFFHIPSDSFTSLGLQPRRFDISLDNVWIGFSLTGRICHISIGTANFISSIGVRDGHSVQPSFFSALLLLRQNSLKRQVLASLVVDRGLEMSCDVVRVHTDTLCLEELLRKGTARTEGNTPRFVRSVLLRICNAEFDLHSSDILKQDDQNVLRIRLVNACCLCTSHVSSPLKISDCKIEALHASVEHNHRHVPHFLCLSHGEGSSQRFSLRHAAVNFTSDEFWMGLFDTCEVLHVLSSIVQEFAIMSDWALFRIGSQAPQRDSSSSEDPALVPAPFQILVENGVITNVVHCSDIQVSVAKPNSVSSVISVRLASINATGGDVEAALRHFSLEYLVIRGSRWDSLGWYTVSVACGGLHCSSREGDVLLKLGSYFQHLEGSYAASLFAMCKIADVLVPCVGVATAHQLAKVSEDYALDQRLMLQISILRQPSASLIVLWDAFMEYEAWVVIIESRRLVLSVEGRTISLGDSFHVDRCVWTAACAAELVVTVDGQVRRLRWDVSNGWESVAVLIHDLSADGKAFQLSLNDRSLQVVGSLAVLRPIIPLVASFPWTILVPMRSDVEHVTQGAPTMPSSCWISLRIEVGPSVFAFSAAVLFESVSQYVVTEFQMGIGDLLVVRADRLVISLLSPHDFRVEMQQLKCEVPSSCSTAVSYPVVLETGFVCCRLRFDRRSSSEGEDVTNVVAGFLEAEVQTDAVVHVRLDESALHVLRRSVGLINAEIDSFLLFPSTQSSVSRWPLSGLPGPLTFSFSIEPVDVRLSWYDPSRFFSFRIWSPLLSIYELPVPLLPFTISLSVRSFPDVAVAFQTAVSFYASQFSSVGIRYLTSLDIALGLDRHIMFFHDLYIISSAALPLYRSQGQRHYLDSHSFVLLKLMDRKGSLIPFALHAVRLLAHNCLFSSSCLGSVATRVLFYVYLSAFQHMERQQIEERARRDGWIDLSRPSRLSPDHTSHPFLSACLFLRLVSAHLRRVCRTLDS
eukprot:ANDGO_01777.mRNA.1 hypothetical protein